ncbi:MAG: hypothetical protein ACPG4T_09720 [Nannocystaceae bacterium]
MTSRYILAEIRARAMTHATRVVLAASMVSTTVQAAEPVQNATSASRPFDNSVIAVASQLGPGVEITPANPEPVPQTGRAPEPNGGNSPEAVPEPNGGNSPEAGRASEPNGGNSPEAVPEAGRAPESNGGIPPEPDDEGIPPEPDDEGIPPEPGDGVNLQPDASGLAGYNPLVDSPEALRAKHWYDAGIVLLVVGTIITGGGIAMAASDPCFLPAGNGCQVAGRNRAALTMVLPGSVMLLGGAASLGYGIVAKRRLRAQFAASRRGVNLGFSLKF